MIYTFDIEDAEQSYNEQKFICDELKTAIQCVEEYCENTEAKAPILDELNTALEYAMATLAARKVSLDAAEQEWKAAQQAPTADATSTA